MAIGKKDKTTATPKKDHELTATEQAKASAAVVQENVKENTKTADNKTAHVLSVAQGIAETLSSHDDFVGEMETAIRAKEDDDYKSVATLKMFEKYLTPEQFANLPYPSSKQDEVEARIRNGSNEPAMWDVLRVPYINAAGEHKLRSTTFYAELARGLPPGQKAVNTINKIEDIKAKNEKSEAVEAWAGDLKAAHRAVNQMKNAVKQAARIRKQLDKFSSLRRFEFEWVRGPYEGDEETPADGAYDKSKLIVTGLGDVVKSTACVAIKNVTEKPARWAYFGLGQFLNWNLDNPATLKTIQDLKNSVRKKAPTLAPTSTTGTITIATAKRYDQSSVADIQDALNGFLSWYKGQSASDESTNYKTLVNLIEHSDEGNATLYEVYKILKPRYEADPNARRRADEFKSKTEGNGNNNKKTG